MTFFEAVRFAGQDPFEHGPPTVRGNRRCEFRRDPRRVLECPHMLRRQLPIQNLGPRHREDHRCRRNIPELKRAQDIAELAYELWQSRGCPDGSPDEDWFRAERELQRRT